MEAEHAQVEATLHSRLANPFIYSKLGAEIHYFASTHARTRF